jgi:hypothetical protein
MAPAQAATVTVEVGSTYVDAGATATDNYDGDITARIATNSTVNTAKLGTYTVAYAVTDSSGNAGQAVRTVNVVDTTKPVITRVGSASMAVLLGSAFTDPGAAAADNYDGDITSRIVKGGSVNTAVAGTYRLTYDVSDSSGNAATQVVRTVTVQSSDTTKPVITLLGSSYVTVKVGRTYADAGATAYDSVDGDITSRIVTQSNVNTSRAGTYYVTYNVKDSAANAAKQVKRIVKVTYFTKTGDEASDLIIASPLNGSTEYVNAGAGHAPLTLTVSAPLGAESVEYTLDGAVVGSSSVPPYAVTVDLDLSAAAMGAHHVGATATMATAQPSVSAESVFNLAPVAAQDDVNNNGIPDNPFATLALEGDSWIHTVDGAKTGDTLVVGAARFEGGSADDPDAPVVLVLDSADDPSREVQVTVPRELACAGETGIVLVALSNDLETLLGSQDAALVGIAPDGQQLANGGQYIEISVLLSPDNGQTFDEVDSARLSANPVHVDVEGLQAVAGSALSLQRHPSYIDSDARTGLFITASDGAWNNANIRNVALESTAIHADLAALSLFAPCEKEGQADLQDTGNGCAAAVGALAPGTPFNGGKAGDMLLTTLALTTLFFAGKKHKAGCLGSVRITSR